MKSLKISFDEGGATLHLDQLVSGAECEIQNALVNIGTTQGSDALYPSRGTNLLTEAVKGAIVDMNSARHSANFAALFTLNFIQETLPTSMIQSADRITNLALTTAEFDGRQLILQLDGSTLDSRTFGTNANILS